MWPLRSLALGELCCKANRICSLFIKCKDAGVTSGLTAGISFETPKFGLSSSPGRAAPGSRGCGMAKARLSSGNGSEAVASLAVLSRHGSERGDIRATFPSQETHI